MADLPELSIVVPLYNEAGRLERGLRAITEHLSHAPIRTELLIVDDGSSDETVTLARRLVTRTDTRILAEPHRGKGGAVRSGMLEATGQFAVFLDIDLATPLEFLEPCLRMLRQGSEVVIGSRRAADARIERPQARVREFLGRGFSALSRSVTGVAVADFTCGFKGFSRHAAREIFSRQRIVNWSFDAEILFLARRLGFTIRELPVRWEDDSRTKGRLGRDIVGSLVGLGSIRLNQVLRRYRLKTG